MRRARDVLVPDQSSSGVHAGAKLCTSALQCRVGFTLIELLVAITLLSVILTGLLLLSRSTLRFTGHTSAIAQSVKDVAMAEGYLADSFRSAKAVFADLTLDVPTEGGAIQSFTCNLASDGRCVAILTPVVDLGQASMPIIDFVLSVFSVEPIGDRYLAAGVPRGFDGQDTLALFEYRVADVCEQLGVDPCTRPPDGLNDPADPLLADGVGLLLVGLSPVDASSEVVLPFSVLSTEEVMGNRLVLRFVTRADSAVGQPFTVRETPVELQVTVRGLLD